MSSALIDYFAASSDPVAAWKAWAEHLSPIFDATALAETRVGPDVRMRSYNLGGVVVGLVSAPAQKLVRPARMVAQQGIDHVLIQLYRSGTSRVSTQRGEVEVKASELVIYDLAQPIVISSSPVVAKNIFLPRALLGERGKSIEALHGSVFSATQDPAAHLFSNYLREIVAVSDRLKADHLPGVADAAARLCSAALPQAPAEMAAAERRVSVEVRTFIQGRLESPDLGPEMICDHFGLSRATLYRQFAADDGVQNYIRERRLSRAMRLLTATEDGPRPRVSSVAYATGFSDEKTFSRAFKRRFGFLPREAAAESLARLSHARTDVASTLGTWIRQLDLMTA